MASLSIGVQGSSSGGNDHTPAASTKGVNLAGKVSQDGKTLLTEDDNVWSVSNADTLKGFAGRDVTVKCRMDPDKRSIRVLYVFEPNKSNSANLRDSAFRR
jgi:hypothetical protein